MELRFILIPWLLIFFPTSNANKFSAETFSRLLSETKAELAKSFFKRAIKGNENRQLLNVTHSNLEELTFRNPGVQNGRMFRGADESFLFNGVDVLRLRKSETPGNRYALVKADDVRLDEGAIYFKNAEWKKQVFLAVCYQKGYCEVRMSAQAANLRLKIDTGMLPLDVSFFGTDEELFLLVVQDPVTIYRWAGTYFSEYYHLDTTGAQSVGIFQDLDKSIITVAQDLGINKVYSKVYVQKLGKIELSQLLPTNQAVRVLPFELSYGEDVLHFIFVLNNISPSSIFWWTGKEFVLWKSLENIFGPRIVYVEKIQSEIFFFISEKNKIYVYHPTATSFELMQIITFDQEVVGIDLRQEKDQMPMLVLLTGSALDPYFKVNLILLEVNYTPVFDKENESSGGIRRCLSKLRQKLDERKNSLERIYKQSEKEPTVDDLGLSSLEESFREVSRKAEKLQRRLELVRNDTGMSRNGRYHVYGDFKIGRMSGDEIEVEVVNGKNVDFENLVSLTKDQALKGTVGLNTLSTDALTAPSVNGVAVEDILTRNKKVQKVNGRFTLAALTANDIKFGQTARLNDIPASELITSRSSENLITGRKIIRKLKAKQVEVDKINNVPSEKWLAEILPGPKSESEDQPLNFTELRIEKLWLSNLNGIPWNGFVDSVYLPLNNETIKGNLRVRGTTKVEKLKTQRMNGIPVGEVEGEYVSANTTCRRSPKRLKVGTLELSPVWDDEFLKEILNEPGSEFDNEIKYFTKAETIDGDVRASHVFVKNQVDVSGFLVGDFEKFHEKYWMKNQDQIISIPVEFKNGFSATNSILVHKINNESLDSFVWTDRTNVVPSGLLFENAVINGDVTLADDVVQNVNLKELNETLVKPHGENVIKGRKMFLGNVTVKNLHADVLNENDVTDFMNLIKNTLNDSENVEVPELIIFGDLEVKDGAQVKTINDVDFNETISKALTWNDPELFNKAQFRSLTVDNLNANNINGVNVEDKLPKWSKTQNEDVYVVIEGNLEVSELNATRVNGINFDKYINQVFQRDTMHTIRGEKIFKEMVTVTGNLKGNLNEYNVTELERIALSKSKFQNITGTYTIENFQANDVEAEYIDGVPRDQILYQDETEAQVINSNVVFENLAAAGDIKAKNFMNGCDLSKVTGFSIENVADFETLEVEGNLSWETPRKDLKGLSHFLTNVVTRSGDQIITGPVVFENDVVLKNVNGKRDFNDIDLEFISRDAVRKSSKDQEIAAPVIFKGAVKVNSIEIMNNVHIDSINGVDITDVDDRLVRKSADVVVKGKKIFKSGFSANYFQADTVNGATTSQIVFYDNVRPGKEIRLPATAFKKLNVFNDFKVLRINGYDFDHVLDKRLLKSGNQTVTGSIIIDGNVFIEGDGNIQRINDVSLEETILADGEVSAKVITGDIEFRDTISIADKLEVDYINGRNITALLEKALLVDDDAIIEGNVEFLSDIQVDGNIDIGETVNKCDLKNVTEMDFTDGSDTTNQQLRKTLQENVEDLTGLSEVISKPVIFMYLKETAQLDLQLPNIHASVSVERNNSVEFNIYGMNFGGCGLPSECYCPTQTNLKIDSLTPPSIEVDSNSTRIFKFQDNVLGVEVNVSTTTVSYSSRCKRLDEDSEEESTSIFWRKLEEEEIQTYEPKIFKGFLSDVKFFRLDDSIYIVMAFYFHPSKNETNNLHTLVYEVKVKDGAIEKVDEIPSSGAQVLELFWTSKGIILVIGNSFDSDLYTDSVNSAIYRFNEYDNKFELLRFVKTHGILSVKSMRYKKTSFIFFVQKQTWPLLILKYNREYDNFYFRQKLDTVQSLVRSNFLSVSVISTATPRHSGDLFVGIVLSDDSFRLLKYKHIEGFVEESYQEQNNVRILHPFWIGSTQYLLAGSASDTSKIYKFVEQGR